MNVDDRGRTDSKQNQDGDKDVLRQKEGYSLAPSYVGPPWIGYPVQIQGPEMAECPDYKATRFELQQLARYWTHLQLDTELEYFFHACSGSQEWRRNRYADDRLDRITQVIGVDAVQKAEEVVMREVRDHLGPELWRVFSEGTPDEREQIWDDFYKGLEYLEKKERDLVTAEKAFTYLRENPSKVFFDEAGDLWSLTDMVPGAAGKQGKQLALKVTTPQGRSSLLSTYTLERPPGWRAPYGL